MKLLKYLTVALILLIPFYLYAGRGPIDEVLVIQTDKAAAQLDAYYDLRNRQTQVQVTNVSDENVTIHVQIFQHDRGCTELNFDDTLTPHDTVVYDLDNVIKNNGNPAPLNLADDSYGYVVVSDRDLDNHESTLITPRLIGNFRIVDDKEYEYRVNMGANTQFNRQRADLTEATFQIHFGTADEAKQADLVGFTYDGSRTSSVRNYAPGISFDVFVYDFDEEPLSCDRRNFACGNIMNYGINEDYPASRGDDVICPGGGLAGSTSETAKGDGSLLGGFVDLINGVVQVAPDVEPSDDIVFAYYIGLNNDDGTGSMDTWIDPTEIPTLQCMTDCTDLACTDLPFTEMMNGYYRESTDAKYVLGPSGICEPGEEMTCDDEFDNDGDGMTDCDDEDCRGELPCEVCDDGINNDGDSDVDCADIDCLCVEVEVEVDSELVFRTCEPIAEVTCNDGFDNDRNYKKDCDDGSEDANCEALGWCDPGREICNNDTDEASEDQEDSDIDCADMECDGVIVTKFGDMCEYGNEKTCDDGFDNDRDGEVDCDDSEDCGYDNYNGMDICWEDTCDDGKDNDGDGYTDCADEDCDDKECDIDAKCIDSICEPQGGEE